MKFKCKAKRHEFINQYVPLVHQVVKKKYGRFYANPDSKQDYVSEGIIGLMEAMKYFKRGKGMDFVNYASRNISKRIAQYCFRKEHMIPLSTQDFRKRVPNELERSSQIFYEDEYFLWSRFGRSHEDKVDVENMVEKLPDLEKAVIKLKFIEDLDDTIIRKKLNIPVSMFYILQNSAINRMRLSLCGSML